jgi:hypothetical protein
MRLLGFVTEREPVACSLNAIGESTQPPRVAPARGPPRPGESVAGPPPFWDELAQPIPELRFAQRISW